MQKAITELKKNLKKPTVALLDAMKSMLEEVAKEGGHKKLLTKLYNLVGSDEAERIIKDAIVDEKQVEELYSLIADDGSYVACHIAMRIPGLVYDEYIREGQELARKNLRVQLRFLLQRMGYERLKSIIDCSDE